MASFQPKPSGSPLHYVLMNIKAEKEEHQPSCSSGVGSSPRNIRDDITYATSSESCRLPEKKTTKVQKVSDEPPDAIVMHTIRLLRYCQELTSVIENFSLRKRNAAKLSVPKFPKLQTCVLTSRRPGDIKAKIEAGDYNNFTHCSPPMISQEVAGKILRKSVAVLLAHAGWDTTTESVLDTMTDIVQDFFVRTCLTLSNNVETRCMEGDLGLIDVVEQTFHDIGLDSMTVVHDFYQSRVVDYHETVLNKSKQLLNEYNTLAGSSCETADENTGDEEEMEVSNESTSHSNSPDDRCMDTESSRCTRFVDTNLSSGSDTSGSPLV